MSFILDANIAFPVEVDGSPKISTDEITYSLIIVRRYAVLTTAYKPLAQGSIDPIYTSAVLVSENSETISGPVTFFTRTYVQIPASRVEYRQIAFTRPGKSRTIRSMVSGAQAIGWDAYGGAPPSTKLVLASVTYTYSTSSLSGNGPVDHVMFNGAVVDFIGDVYENRGIRTVDLGGGRFISEPNFQYIGSTNPQIIPPNWVFSVNVTRWKGPIWQAERIVVSTA